METETIDKLFLELSQVTQATTQKEIDFIRALVWLEKAYENDSDKMPDFVNDAFDTALEDYNDLAPKWK